MWYAYILECRDGSYYTGITKGDGPACLERRVRKHNSGHGAKYTRSRRPVSLIWYESVSDSKGDALRRERVIKKLSRPEKEKLVR